MKETLQAFLAAALIAVVLWFLATTILLFAPGNCYDTPQYCRGERTGKP